MKIYEVSKNGKKRYFAENEKNKIINFLNIPKNIKIHDWLRVDLKINLADTYGKLMFMKNKKISTDKITDFIKPGEVMDGTDTITIFNYLQLKKAKKDFYKKYIPKKYEFLVVSSFLKNNGLEKTIEMVKETGLNRNALADYLLNERNPRWLLDEIALNITENYFNIDKELFILFFDNLKEEVGKKELFFRVKNSLYDPAELLDKETLYDYYANYLYSK